ncbi:hypothetical protein EIN_267720 [Entamoeba invadens IP1]|uniref:Uncharacterized protein n=1 Tax=Entamoeba invadens IP1 TaxID=370355 RepID=A0A0A1U884_ENTIV|nr:hypothetical protein EIN_267720 [Entamoeba invadens IP1]ELP91046.1 hypothetical protein EIN_267720 [Entamoeba invadens IP1]|eukprot:XP_004257817.1 hypothetical protein EIN_267720 [Entamoeba invadens IP1]
MRIEQVENIGGNRSLLSSYSSIEYDCYNDVFSDTYKRFIDCYVYKDVFYDQIGETKFPTCGIQLLLKGTNSNEAVCIVRGYFTTEFINGITQYDAERTILVTEDVYNQLSWGLMKNGFNPVCAFFKHTSNIMSTSLAVVRNDSNCFTLRAVDPFNRVHTLLSSKGQLQIDLNGTFTYCTENPVESLSVLLVNKDLILFPFFNFTRTKELQYPITNYQWNDTNKQPNLWAPRDIVYGDINESLAQKYSDYYDDKFTWTYDVYSYKGDDVGKLPLEDTHDMYIIFKLNVIFYVQMVFNSSTTYFVVKNGSQTISSGLLTATDSSPTEQNCHTQTLKMVVYPFSKDMCTINRTLCRQCGGSVDCVIIKQEQSFIDQRCGYGNNGYYLVFKGNSYVIDIINSTLTTRTPNYIDSFCPFQKNRCFGYECDPTDYLKKYGGENTQYIGCFLDCGVCDVGYSCNGVGKCIKNRVPSSALDIQMLTIFVFVILLSW